MVRRGSIEKHLREMDLPEIGIFWFTQRPGDEPKLLASSDPFQLGKSYGIYIDGHEDHVNFWEVLKQSRIPWLQDFGVKDWPRGRVLFNTAMKHFEVDLNQQLLADPFRAEILKHFKLPYASTVFSADPHYAETRFTFVRQGPRERTL